MAFKDEVYTSLTLSSVKGVSRAFTTKHPVLKVLWGFGVILFLGICTCQVYLNFYEYFSHPQVLTLEEEKASFSDSEPWLFPTMTLCNVNPFTSNISLYEILDVPTPKDYIKIVDRRMNGGDSCSENERKVLSKVGKYLKTTRGYYQHVGLENIKKISHQHLVISCNITVIRDFKTEFIPCDEAMTISPFVSPDFGNCLRYEPKIGKDKMLGISFIMYADTPYEDILDGFNLNPPEIVTRGGGFVVMLYDNKVIPTLKGALTTTSVGQTSASTIIAEKMQRLSTPYTSEPCFSEEDMPTVEYMGSKMIKDQKFCIGECVKRTIETQCNCTSLFVTHHPEAIETNLPYCESLHAQINDTIKWMSCIGMVSKHSTMTCEKECKIPCSEMKFRVKTSTLKWPMPYQIGSFYKEFIKYSPFEGQFAKYQKTYEAMQGGWDKVPILDALTASLAIEHNFAKVAFILEEIFYMNYVAKPKISIAGFISQLGGALNLWSGISVVIIIEVLDLLFRLCFGLCKNKSHQNNDSDIEKGMYTMVDNGKCPMADCDSYVE